MIKKICDRCKREENAKDRSSYAKVLYYDLCPKCQPEFLQYLDEFFHNKNQTEVNQNEQEKTSNT